MKTSQFSDAQKAFILRQGADGVPVADICRKAGISQATYFVIRRGKLTP
jgi:putative transposase